MGFYPYMKARIERRDVDGKRKIVAEAFDSVLNKWIEHVCDSVEEACVWIMQKMNSASMSALPRFSELPHVPRRLHGCEVNGNHGPYEK